jgi:antitoxin (DNA-binding transcriptional repressor) of toxin-antitoxin stability system
MPSMELDQLGDARQLKDWLAAGETVELREQDRVVARIVPEPAPQAEPAEWPDFIARLKENFGERTFPAVDIFLEERDKERY